jgi:predicted ATP-dependent endonuclease of OLD family
MALIRHLARTRKADTDSPTKRLLLIDEPELYLHPQGIRRIRQALYTLSTAGFQVVFATHSPLMLSRDNTADTVIIRKDKDKGCMTQLPLRHAVQTALNDAPSQTRTLFELGNLADIYFSDLIVLCEGKTERRLLPLAYERLYGQPIELDHTTVVSIGSCSDIPKALSVLNAMNINACAIADLDFAFVEARKGGTPILPKDDADITQAKAILARIQPIHGFTLGNNGFPQNQGIWKAADIWALVAEETDGKALAESVHNLLKAQNIWVWPHGCIEHITGATDKGEDAIIGQEEAIQAMTPEQIEMQMPLFKACFEWIRSF